MTDPAGPAVGVSGSSRSAPTPGPSFDVLVVGEINPDIVVRDRDPRPAFGQVERLVEAVDLSVGSSSVITAMGTARLGLRTAFVGLVGDDPLGHFMVEAMAARGIDVRGVQVRADVATGASVVLSSPDDRAILTAPGAIPLLRLDDVPTSLLGMTRHLHVGSPFLLDRLRPDLAALLGAAHSAGASTSVDPNWDPGGRWDGGLRAALAGTDILLPNAQEALHLTGHADPLAAARALAAAGPVIVTIKLGPDGALAVTTAGDVHRVAALPVTVCDTTGAGDSFDAGFLAGRLLGRSVAASLALGVACGSLSTTRAGGVAAQPTLADADAAVADAGLG